MKGARRRDLCGELQLAQRERERGVVLCTGMDKEKGLDRCVYLIYPACICIDKKKNKNVPDFSL